MESEEREKGRDYWPEVRKPRRLSARGFALTTSTAFSAANCLAPHAQPPTELSRALSDRPRRFEEGCQLNHAKPPSESFPKDNLLRNSRRRSLFKIRAAEGETLCQERLGGLLRHCYRKAA